jgi:sugar (pentulose or hexulose) kinase
LTRTVPLFLGIDVGSTGCRAIVIDGNGAELARASVPLPAPARPVPGRAEQPPQVWWTGVCASVRGLPAQSRAAVAALAVDGTSGTVVLTDPEGVPLGPALMYDDARATTEARLLAGLAPADTAVHSATSGLAKALWLARTFSGIAARLAHPSDWVLGRLCGRAGLADEHNALKLGYDPVNRRWPDWVARTGVPPAWLPEVLPTATPVAPLDAAVAADLGLPPQALAVTGTTDSTAATIAAGVNAPGDAVTALGTTMVMKVLAPQPVWSTAYGVYSHRIGDLWLVGGASNSGGAVLRQHFSDGQLAALSTRIDPTRPSSLDYYPLPRPGERFPLNDAVLAPRLAPRPDDPVELLHGLLEGMAAIEALGYRRLAELGAPYPTRVLTTGGGAVNAAWTAIRARRLGIPVRAADQAEAARGAALLACRGWQTAQDGATAP